MASTILSRTPGVAGNRRKWTFSTWVKLGDVSGSRTLFGSYSSSGNYNQIWFQDGDFRFDQYTSSSSVGTLITDRKFKDPAAWYNIVCVWDSDNAAAGDRMKLYVNGVEETSFSQDTNPAQYLDSYVNSTSYSLEVGGMNAGEYFDGIMAHTHFADGQAYAPTVFGETDSTSGIWIAKTSPSVTYGTNGFFLKYASGALGTDSSGEGNTMAVSGTMTTTKDTPDNNFCMMNPLNNYLFNGTYSNGNNTVATDVKCWNSTTLGMTTGKWYWETKIVSATSGEDWTVGFAGITATGATDDGGSTEGTDVFHYRATGAVWNNGSTSLTTTSYTTGDIISIALDLTNNKWYVGKNGTWLNSGDPTSGATGTGAVGSPTAAASTSIGAYFPSVSYLNASQSGTFSTNFGNGYFGTTSTGTAEADDAGIGVFKYDVPAGYYALCTNNLGDQS